uniref:Uncharacterized protein n=1 Tax=Glossina pallidipes TaxID=7398 RepID=A0A1A9ZNC9_GLOPL
MKRKKERRKSSTLIESFTTWSMLAARFSCLSSIVATGVAADITTLQMLAVLLCKALINSRFIDKNSSEESFERAFMSVNSSSISSSKKLLDGHIPDWIFCKYWQSLRYSSFTAREVSGEYGHLFLAVLTGFLGTKEDQYGLVANLSSRSTVRQVRIARCNVSPPTFSKYFYFYYAQRELWLCLAAEKGKSDSSLHPAFIIGRCEIIIFKIQPETLNLFPKRFDLLKYL